MLKLHNKEYDNLNDKNLILWNSALYAEMTEGKKGQTPFKTIFKASEKNFFLFTKLYISNRTSDTEVWRLYNQSSKLISENCVEQDRKVCI